VCCADVVLLQGLDEGCQELLNQRHLQHTPQGDRQHTAPHKRQ
jgi:hypothetical protein